MATDNTQLTKAWITHLKRNQIAFSSKDEPGRLEYRKKVTSDTLSHFLEGETDFTEEQISNAIHMVLAKKAQSGRSAKLRNNPTTGTSVATRPEQPQQQAPKQIGSNQPKAPPPPAKKRFSKDGATDIEFRDINEELRDDTAYTLDEKDVEDVISLLTSSTSSARPQSGQSRGQRQRGPAALNPAEIQSKKEDEMRQLKRIVRDTMTAAQRKALWRVLTDA